MLLCAGNPTRHNKKNNINNGFLEDQMTANLINLICVSNAFWIGTVPVGAKGAVCE